MSGSVELESVGLAHAGRSDAQRTAAKQVLLAFFASRALVWAVGVAVASVLGVRTGQAAHLDPAWQTAPFGSDLANLMVAPAARFDSTWLLEITRSGYAATGTAAFFPLYPALATVAGWIVGSALLGGILISSATSLAGLYLLHRLTALDYGSRVARTTVWITAFFPVAFTFSAFYTEGLFLVLSVGAIYAARLGRWQIAGLATLLAATTRSVGIVVLVPVALLYLYGPRADRAADRPDQGRRPPYRFRGDFAWVAAAPIGVLAFVVYLGVATGNPLATFGAETEWNRVLAPLAAPVMGLISAGHGAFELFFGSRFAGAISDSRAGGALNLALFGFLVLAVWLTVQVARRMPVAYAAYVVASLALPFSTPAADEPLMSLPRFMMVLFPLWIMLAIRVEAHARRRTLAAAQLVALVASSALFVAWVLAP